MTGVEDLLGRLVAERLAARDDLETVLGVASEAKPAVAGVEVLEVSPDYGGITDLLRARQIDTIVHADRRWARSSAGRNRAGEHIIATMRLTAAAADPATAVRSFVMASSTRVYPVSSRAARLHPESEALQPGRGTLSASLVEAEGYVRDLATTSPNLSASIMRLANLACPGADDPLPALLASPIVPAVWGFDPSVQLLNIDDAVTALEHAADHDLAGVYNVGADELVRWRRAIRLAGKPHIELPVAPTGTLTRLIQWPYRLTVGDDVVNELKFGRAAATDAITRSGFRPTMTSARLASVRRGSRH